MKQSDIHIIIQKLDDFIRKYYLNECVKGLILFVLIFLFYLFTLAGIEYFAFLPIYTRTFLFYTTVFLSLFAFLKYVLLPLFRMYKIGKVISHIEASKIVVTFFPEIKDTLLNALELSKEEQNTDNSLVIAAINQKIKLLKPIVFSSAIDLKKLISYWKYAFALIVLFITISVFYPNALQSGVNRIVKHSVYFEKPAPFSFILSNDTLAVVKGDDYKVSVRVEGKYVPNNIEIVIGGNSFFMQKKTNTTFEYIIRNCNNSLSFNFLAEEFVSQKYELQVKPLPQLLSFTINARVPAYTGLQNFTIKNIGDITVPAGTQLQWNVDALDSKKLKIYFNNSKSISQLLNVENHFELKQTIFKNTQYSFIGQNDFFKDYKIIDYTISVIPDLIPSINVIDKRDSINFFTYYYKGIIQDDYGFTGLQFVYFDAKNPKQIKKTPIQYLSNVTKQEMYFMFDFSQFEKGSKIEYYFEVFDNDAINGRKSARTTIQEFKVPTSDELEKLDNQFANNIEKSMNQSMSATEDLLKDIKTMQKKLLNENLTDWERKELLQEIQDKQNTIKQKVNEMSQMLQQKNELQNQFSPQDQQLLEKQKQIEDLLKNLMDDELQKLFDEFNKLMDNFKKDEFMKKSEDMKQSYEELSKQMDRDLELLKKMDVEKNIKSTAQKLDELAQKQKELAQELQKTKQPTEQQKLEQKKIEDEFKKAKDSYEDAGQKNEELKNKLQMNDFKPQFDQIEQSMQQSQEQMQNKQSGKSSKSMQQSSKQMEELSEAMQQMLQEQMKQKAMEDMDNLRQILDNLLTFSYQQEALISQTNKLSYADPKYATITSKQNALADNFTIIRDSLYSLSLRVPQLSSPINQELFTINKKMKRIISYLEDQQRSGAMVEQQYVMTSANNLMLLLGEVLDAMQKAAAQQMQGNQQCDKPGKTGKGKPSMSQISQMQQSLKQQMEQMLQQMKDGSMQGKGMQKQMSQMLMQQQMMGDMMNNMMKNGQISPEGVQQLKEIQKMMDKTEQDIVNQNITPQTIQRQEQILTRLLESDKSIRERDIDKKRESNEAKDNYSIPKAIFKEDKNPEIRYEDVLKQTNLKLNTYYLKIFQDYLLEINQN